MDLSSFLELLSLRNWIIFCLYLLEITFNSHYRLTIIILNYNVKLIKIFFLENSKEITLFFDRKYYLSLCFYSPSISPSKLLERNEQL